jgi:hypothetical protein
VNDRAAAARSPPAHPDQIRTLVAHEPPRFGPPAQDRKEGEEDLHATYLARGVVVAMVRFMTEAGLGMSDSECSVVVGDQGALVRSIDDPVVPDAGCEGEQALSDPHEDAEVGTPAMLFEPELALEGVVDGLDALPDPAQLAVAWRRRPQKKREWEAQ